MKQSYLVIISVLFAVSGFSQTITGISPDRAKPGSTILLTVTGSGTSFDQGSHSVQLTQGTITIDPYYTYNNSPEKIEGAFWFPEHSVTGGYTVVIKGNVHANLTYESGFTLDWPASTEDVRSEVEKAFKVYPNPSFDGNFVLDKNIEGACEMRVLDMNGRTVYSRRINAQDKQVNVTPGNLSKGLYMIMIDNGKERYTDKILILETR